MVELNSVAGLRGRWLVILSLLALGCSMAVGAFLWLAVELHTLASIADQVAQAKPLMSGLRFGLIAMLAIAWPILGTLERRGREADGARHRWLAMRWRVVGWLLVIELVIGQNVLGRFAMAVAGLT